ncbi:MAG: primosomal protein N' [Gammaproteobacteria bacterium]|nr:primosomal protein N' [Gammaproteobacteria bacterium]
MNSTDTDTVSDYQVQVAVPVPVRQTFDYLCDQCLVPGIRVLVPFGQRKLVGMVISNQNKPQGRKLKQVEAVLDSHPSIDPALLNLVRWASGYYHHPIGEVLNAALPGLLRRSRRLENPLLEDQYRVHPGLNGPGAQAVLRRAPQQQAVFALISKSEWISLSGIKSQSGSSGNRDFNRLLSGLLDKRLIEKRTGMPGLDRGPRNAPDLRLTEGQQEIVNRISRCLGTFSSHLLHGVTGSGKTEVYIQLAKNCIQQGGQALVLIPEIALTPQLAQRFTDHLGNGVCLFHSGMTALHRYRTWWKARRGVATVILGTRSAIFTPLKHPGIIIVDEEHDRSFKQNDGFRYHARDLAIKRASLEKVPVLLGSATPSLESIKNAESGVHRIYKLQTRIGPAQLPRIELLDLKRLPRFEGLSPPLLEAVSEVLENRQQAILFINRRGFAPVAQCHHCAWQARCDRCDAFLTYHRKSNTFRCHHCGKITGARSQCPNCSKDISHVGVGTQRIENILRRQFPRANICRFDRDEISTQRKLEKTLEEITRGRIDIIVGTQLISKGHDFPGIALVGIVDPDRGLYSTDFRAPEYLFQQLTQVAGRAGRSSNPGRVIIQTSHPENPYLQMILNQDIDQFYTHCTRERRQTGLPPYGFLALWRAESKNEFAGQRFLQYVRRLGMHLLSGSRPGRVRIMDPVSSPMEKLAGQYRAQLLVRSEDRKSLHRLLARWVRQVETAPRSRRVRWSIDLDPVDLF